MTESDTKHKVAVMNIERRMHENTMMHYFNDLNNGRTQFSAKNKKRREVLQKKAYLSTFLQSDTYERFLILETYCAKGTYLSSVQYKIIQEKMPSFKTVERDDENAVCVGGKFYPKQVERRLVLEFAKVTKSELAPFFDMLKVEEFAEIKQLIERHIAGRTESCVSLQYFATTLKLRALLKNLEERIAENEEETEGE